MCVRVCVALVEKEAREQSVGSHTQSARDHRHVLCHRGLHQRALARWPCVTDWTAVSQATLMAHNHASGNADSRAEEEERSTLGLKADVQKIINDEQFSHS